MIAPQLPFGLEGIQPVEAGPRTLDHGQRDRVVQGHDRSFGDPEKELVERQDLGPVGGVGPRGLVMGSRDRGLELVWPDRWPLRPSGRGPVRPSG